MKNKERSIFVNRSYQTLSRKPYAHLVSIMLIVSVFVAFMTVNGIKIYEESSVSKKMIITLQKRINSDNEKIGSHLDKDDELRVFASELNVIKDIKKSSGVDPLLVLSVIESNIPSDIFIESFAYDAAAGEVNIKASAKGRSSLSKFVEKIESNSIVNEIYLKEQEAAQGNYSFGLLIRLSNDANAIRHN